MSMVTGQENRYAPLLRPASALPTSIRWEYIEAPWDLAHLRMDLPRSENRHGLISTSRALTPDELAHFGLRLV